MKQSEVLDLFRKCDALLEGHFLLSSGLHSSQYIQCAKVLQYPEYGTKLGKAIAELFQHVQCDVVVSPAIGGILIAQEVARALGIRAVFCERKDGKMILRRGFEIEKGEQALIIEDIITTGRSTMEVIAVVESFKGCIVGIGAIIDRSEKAINFPVEFKSLAKLSFKNYNPNNCLICKQGKIPLVKPGSRKV
ncbi:orotate phosphoribosyltransferase [bacterium]|nr:orotate phosphoribosyltransferase [bacterium]